MSKPRLFVETTLNINDEITIDGDSHHYLARVMRIKLGQDIVIFNGNSPSLNAKVISIDKKHIRLWPHSIEKALAPLTAITLAFAPIKKVRTDFIIEKSVELGCSEIKLMKTDYTNAERVNMDRLTRHAIEAVEQCGGNQVPNLCPLTSIDDILKETKNNIIFCDENSDTKIGREAIKGLALPVTIFIGPEGGFSSREHQLLHTNGAHTISLGPRILRADTAAVSAITLVQSLIGDW